MEGTLDEAAVFDTLDCVVIVLAPPSTIRSINRYGRDWLGHEPAPALCGQPFRVLQPDERLLQAIAARTQTRPALIEATLARRDRSQRSLLWRLSHRDDASAAQATVVLLGFETTPQPVADAPASVRDTLPQLAGAAIADPLTGLPGRIEFLQRLSNSLAEAQRAGQAIAVAHISVDDFSAINDSVGRRVTDRLLVEIAARIRRTLRQADQLARLGESEFAVVLATRAAASDDRIGEVAHRVLQALRLPFAGSDLAGEAAAELQTYTLTHATAALPMGVTASIGVACFPHDDTHPGELLRHAAQAGERARAAGGNTFLRFDQASAQRSSQQHHVRNELRQALGNGELRLHYQPQVSLFSGMVVGVEALVRWQHPRRGLLLPGEFVPLAEQSDDIIALGNWVLAETCRQIRAWRDAGLPAVKVAINLAARHFHVVGLPTAIASALADNDVAAHRLEVEITEGAMMRDVAAAIRAMAQLKALGVRIALDDFGTGYSSLAYLSRFPIDVVKIDQSFVADITTNPVNAAIAQATIAMSHKLGKIVLAEGVESEEQMQYLRRSGCDEIQGYFFSRPLAADAVTRLMRDGVALAIGSDDGDATAARASVLFVDDERGILSALERTLRREGYRVLLANSAAEGFALLARHRVQLIVSDQRMPEMSGTEFLARAKTLYPDTVRMVLSGHSDISAVTDSINKGAVYRFLHKPWDDEQLKSEITGALCYWRERYAPRSEKGKRSEQ